MSQKEKIIRALSNPKKAISVSFIVGVLLLVWLYPIVGKAPIPDLPKGDETISGSISSGDSIDLAFPKSGRIDSVYVKQGDAVKKGEVLAKLSAPDAEGLVSQAKGALSLAQAQYANLNLDYANTKKQQDIIVSNAYNALLKSTPEAVALDSDADHTTINYPIPTISGNYLLGKEGVITIKTYSANRGLSFTASGLVDDTNVITGNPMPIGNSGLFIQFSANVAPNLTWIITLPNTNSPSYATNKSAYDLAIANRDKVLSELSANIGNENGGSVAKAQVDAAEGAYEAALGAYQNNLIVAPSDGVATFVDQNLKSGQSVVGGKTVISVKAN